ARRRALGLLPARLPAAGSRARQAVPRPLPRQAPGATCHWPPTVLRRSSRINRSTRLPPSPGAAAQAEVGRVRQATLRRAPSSARLSVAIHASRRHLEPALDLAR